MDKKICITAVIPSDSTTVQSGNGWDKCPSFRLVAREVNKKEMRAPSHVDLVDSNCEGQTHSDRVIEAPVRFPKSARYSTNEADEMNLSTHDFVADG